MNHTILITAHSGCENTRPNTMGYLRKAIQLPCDVIEIDVRKYEETLWLSHDVINQTQGLIKLEEALKFLSNYSKIVNCDLKEEIFNDVIACVQKYKMDQQAIYTGSVTLENIQKNEKYKNYIFLNIENIYSNVVTTIHNAEHVIKKYTELGVGGININFKLINRDFIKQANLAKVKIAVWTVDNKEDLDSITKMKIHSITTHKVMDLHHLLEG